MRNAGLDEAQTGIKTLAPWKKSYDQPRQHIKKQRHYFANKGPSSQSYGFSSSHVWMGELGHKESRALKNWCFWTVVLEKTLRVPWTARRSNQSTLKEVSSEYSLKGLMVQLKLQYVATWSKELTHWKRRWCWERLKVGGEGDDRGWDGWMASLIQWTLVWINSGSWWWTGRPGVLQSMGSQRVGHDWATELNWYIKYQYVRDNWSVWLIHKELYTSNMYNLTLDIGKNFWHLLHNQGNSQVHHFQ